MDKIAVWLKAYIDTHPFDPGDSDCETILDQLYQAYAGSHESNPPHITIKVMCGGILLASLFVAKNSLVSCPLPLEHIRIP